MITGVETADLVRAPSSLLVSAVEHEQEGMERLSDWSKSQTEFLAFMDVIGQQALLFGENLEELLSPVITSDAYVNVLLLDPTGPSQPGTAFEEKLMDRLSNSFQVLLQNHR